MDYLVVITTNRQNRRRVKFNDLRTAVVFATSTLQDHVKTRIASPAAVVMESAADDMPWQRLLTIHYFGSGQCFRIQATEEKQ